MRNSDRIHDSYIIVVIRCCAAAYPVQRALLKYSRHSLQVMKHTLTHTHKKEPDEYKFRASWRVFQAAIFLIFRLGDFGCFYSIFICLDMFNLFHPLLKCDHKKMEIAIQVLFVYKFIAGNLFSTTTTEFNSSIVCNNKYAMNVYFKPSDNLDNCKIAIRWMWFFIFNRNGI